MYTQTKEDKICLSVYEATLENTIETSRVHDKEMKKMLNFGTHEVTTNLKSVVNSIVVRLKNQPGHPESEKYQTILDQCWLACTFHEVKHDRY